MKKSTEINHKIHYFDIYNNSSYMYLYHLTHYNCPKYPQHTLRQWRALHYYELFCFLYTLLFILLLNCRKLTSSHKSHYFDKRSCRHGQVVHVVQSTHSWCTEELSGSFLSVIYHRYRYHYRYHYHYRYLPKSSQSSTCALN